MTTDRPGQACVGWPGPARSGERGLTLLELLVALSLLALVLGGGIYRFVVSGTRSARTTNSFVQAQSQVRAALDAIVDEARWAQRVVAAGPTSVTLFVPQSTPFSAGSPYAVTFAYDAAADAVTRQEDPDAGGPLPPGPAVAVASGIVQRDGSDGLRFVYFDNTGTSLGSAPADPATVARVRVILTATWRGVSRSFTGDAALRAR
ncbi:MAG: prepilin-type N-terminal cleavage/methylation domain-containing protein [Armatimonadota bacterium]|nr:prepilin-type N-terminal cleavage/methylation domain-containing protein [Armatimonadota bacterium]MDR7449408.1 prepilin-type N-terminal cleavage/methylation domain-containing protein [Armatimonadota bacterium]MDR7459821.1 prepilin-type N-terminal cleavage/methylation domain-containing protein [Armatimonadota bacterium]MDR7480250.1 prepilin-type N-terminal cleavage/methylation domain-containing protein [Armatimonadota bacterium]MDR7488685.1 prepilin-type N-terminal cleavage/methylation domain